MDKRKRTQAVALLRRALLIGAACAAVAALASQTELVRAWELKTLDLRMKLFPGPRINDIVMLYVDEPSLRHIEEMGAGWPWPRELYAQALSFLRRGGARAVFFDLFFSENSVYGVADDAVFAKGVAQGPPTYLAIFASAHPAEDDPRVPLVLAKSAVRVMGAAPAHLPAAAALDSLPIEPLVAAAAGFGNVQSSPDIDGIYRRMPLAWRLKDTIVPSLALKIAADLAGGGEVAWPSADAITVRSRHIPLDESGSLIIRYPRGPMDIATYSLAEILVAEQQIMNGETPRLDPTIMRDKIVIVGLSAPGLYDLKPSPVGHLTPGPFIHAAAIDTLMRGTTIAPLRQPQALLMTLIAACVAAAAFGAVSRGRGIGLVAAAVAAIAVAPSLALYPFGLWVPLVMPVSAALMASAVTLTRKFLVEGRTKRAIKHAFGQYISPEVVNIIAEDPANIRLDGARRRVTLFFSDIAGFTSTSENLDPEELVARLNRYLTLVTKTIIDARGTLDKYIGDAVMAFWGAPLNLEDHERRAVTTALTIQSSLGADTPFPTRIGIHTGEAVVGNIGSDLRFNYTAIGDTVNLASRIEGLNKYFGTRILLSGETLKGLSPDVKTRHIGRVAVVGRSQPIDIYEPLDPSCLAEANARAWLESFNKGIDLFAAQDYEGALSRFREVERYRSDPVAMLYVRICEDVRARHREALHDGVISFTTK